MRFHHQHPSIRSGFTLIELMIVLVLIAIMTAMIIPEMRGTMEGELLRSTSRELVRGLSLAHSQSITLNQRHRLVINQSKHRYQVERFARGTDEGTGFMPVRGIDGTEGVLSEKIKIELRPQEPAEGDESPPADNPPHRAASSEDSVNPAIEFQPDGTADAVEIQLHDRMGFGLALRVSPITSRIQIAELQKRGGS